MASPQAPCNAKQQTREDWCLIEVWKKRTGCWAVHATWEGSDMESEHTTQGKAVKEALLVLNKFQHREKVSDADS